MCWLYWNLGASVSWNPQGVFRPVMGLLCFTVILADDIKVASVHTWRRSYGWGTFCDWLQNGTVCVLQKHLHGLVVQSELIEYLFMFMVPCKLIYINNCPTRCNTKQSIYYSASALDMFRVSTTPIFRSTQNFLQRGHASLVTFEGGTAQKIWPVPEAVVTVLCTPDDGCGWHPKHVQWTCRIINRLFCVASRWTVINIVEYHYITRQQNVDLRREYAASDGNLITASALNNRHRVPLLPSALVGCGGGRTFVMWCSFDARGSR